MDKELMLDGGTEGKEKRSAMIVWNDDTGTGGGEGRGAVGYGTWGKDLLMV